ncbi:MAG TPA: hypothetical protein VHF88_06500 [Thermoleophilaceae bacterium]|nr:hypothetical protein [Thermoleophilaceae bacterium]
MLLRLVYWLVVVAISLALVVGLILYLESRDQSSVEGANAAPAAVESV